MTALIKSFLPRFLFILGFFLRINWHQFKKARLKKTISYVFLKNVQWSSIPNMLRKTVPKQQPAQQQKKQDGNNCLCLKQVRQVDFS